MAAYTERNIKQILAAWPPVVSLDEGELLRLRDTCDSGGKGRYGRKLKWADYLLLECEGFPDTAPGFKIPSTIVMGDVRGDGSSLRAWTLSEIIGGDDSPAPTKLEYSIRVDRIDGIIELKTVSADLSAKLGSAYKKGGRWSVEAERLFTRHLRDKLTNANGQLRDTRSLLSCENAIGIVILIDQAPDDLPITGVGGFLFKTIQSIAAIDALVYLKNRSMDGLNHPPQFIAKDHTNPAIKRFLASFISLFVNVRTDAQGDTGANAVEFHMTNIVGCYRLGVFR